MCTASSVIHFARTVDRNNGRHLYTYALHGAGNSCIRRCNNSPAYAEPKACTICTKHRSFQIQTGCIKCGIVLCKLTSVQVCRNTFIFVHLLVHLNAVASKMCVYQCRSANPLSAHDCESCCHELSWLPIACCAFRNFF